MIPLLLSFAALAGGPDYWAFRAEQFAVREEWTAAIDNADEAVRLDHANPRRYLERAYIKLKARRFAEALGDANRAELRYRRFGIQTMEAPYLSGEILRSSAMSAADLNEASVVLEVADIELKRIDDELRAPAPQPGETEEEQRQARDERMAFLTARLGELDELREKVSSRWEKLSTSNDALKQAKESYSIAIGRLPPSPHPYSGRKLADEALRGNQEVLDKAQPILEKADALYESVASSIQGLSRLPPTSPTE